MQAEDGSMSLEVQLRSGTVWLTQAQMAELFGKERSVITKHISNVFMERTGQKAMCIFTHIAFSR